MSDETSLMYCIYILINPFSYIVAQEKNVIELSVAELRKNGSKITILS